MQSILPVILAGGSGSRLWPRSRELYPKQFLALCGQETMFQSTLTRLDGLDTKEPFVVCNEEHRFLVAEQARLIQRNLGAIILEPAARNTAPAIALAAFHAAKLEEDPLLLILPADHLIKNEAAFCEAIETAIHIVDQGSLLTFGLTPTHPETAFGYIKIGKRNSDNKNIFEVDTFVEKPTSSVAESYLASGKYLWNSGMFFFRASTYLNELQSLRPEIFEFCQEAISSGCTDNDFYRPGEAFELCPPESIDYAVMEDTKNCVVMPLDIGWSDVGSWDALWEVSDKDQDGNCLNGDIINIRSKNSLIHSDERLIATIGVSDLIIVDTADALLVANKKHVQEVKNIVALIKECKRQEHYTHMKVYRPWGSYESLEQGDGFQVKRITVNPGASLSLQMHHHRSEHWIVVKGTAVVTRNEEEYLLSENESTYIPLGATHRLTNPGKLLLELIEVQVGTYLGEDDIVRFEDKYGR